MNRLYRGFARLALSLQVLFFLTVTITAPAAAQSGSVLHARFSGPVTPVLQSYIDRAIQEAENTGATALVLELDTPGGSVAITKQITQRMTSSTVPVVVFVSPRGAHAGSAGTFITLAAHFAAMAPGSSIGAASPVGSEGADLDETMKAKETNILVADIKNLAARRGDKAVAWAEKAVAEAAAATADEALGLGVIDIIAADVPDVLRQLDGRTAPLAGTNIQLRVSDLPVREIDLTAFENFLNILTNPALAALLLTVGINAILFELSSPGGYVAGIIGIICLLLALFALGTLDANWAGLGFIILAFVLFVMDIKAPTHGALTIGGIASFVVGAFMLFDTTSADVPWAAIIGGALGSGAFFAFAMTKALRAQRLRPVTGLEGMVGMEGTARGELAPRGMVMVNGELWRADAIDGPIPDGERVVVVSIEGFRAKVRRAE